MTKEKDYKGLTIEDAITCLYGEIIKEIKLVNGTELTHETIFESKDGTEKYKATFKMEVLNDK